MSKLIVDTLQQGNVEFDVLAYDEDMSSSGSSEGRVINWTGISDYKFIELDFFLRPTNDNVNLCFRVGDSAADTSTAYAHAEHYANFTTNPSYGDSGHGSTNEIAFWSGVGNATTDGVIGKMKMTIAERVFMHFQTGAVNYSGTGYTLNGAGLYYGSDVVDLLQLYHSGGTDSWAAGWYCLRGMKITGNG